jgi:hypothetical protein
MVKPTRAPLPGKTQVTAPTLIFGVVGDDAPEWRIGIPPCDGTLHSFAIEYEVPAPAGDVEYPPVTLEVWAERRGVRFEVKPGQELFSLEQMAVKAGDKLRMTAKCPPGVHIWVGAVFEASQTLWLKQEGESNAQDIQQGQVRGTGSGSGGRGAVVDTVSSASAAVDAQE